MPTARKGLIALVILAVLGSVYYGFFANAKPAADASPAASNPAASSSALDRACAENEGVTVVVDFGTSSDLEPVTKCVPDFAGTGWAALEAAGLNPEGTDEFPSGFVCRIDGVPTTAEQDCADTPTYAEGNWAYYFATVESDGWMISGAGSAMRSPECGTVEGWRFIENGESSGSLMPRPAPEVTSCD